jgi:pyruvyltransferase
MIKYLSWHICRAPNNAGDWVGPYLFEKITGSSPIRLTKDTAKHDHIYSCGSVLQFTKAKSIVWGSGFISPAKVPATIKVLAVRGPLTRKVLINQGIKCPAVYGDPALLLPKFYNPVIEKQYSLGIIPHYIEHQKVSAYFQGMPNILIIDINRPIEKVLDDILSCDCTLSTSLHGIIFSHAYNVPCLWARYPQTKVIGGNFKFTDYYLSRGISGNKPRIITTLPKQTAEVVKIVKTYRQPTEFNCEPLMSACPFGKTRKEL